jgi:hypothetical protein
MRENMCACLLLPTGRLLLANERTQGAPWTGDVAQVGWMPAKQRAPVAMPPGPIDHVGRRTRVTTAGCQMYISAFDLHAP